MSDPGASEPRWWRRRRDLALAAARAAQGEAAVALLALDRTQTETSGRVEMVAAVEGENEARQLLSAWQPVDGAADAALVDYLALLERYDVDADLALDDAERARESFAAAGQRMRAASDAVAAFPDRFSQQFAAVSRALAGLPEQLAAAADAVEQADRAVADAHARGFRTTATDGLLRRSHEQLAMAREGAVRHGLTRVQEASRQAADTAREVVREIQELPRRREQVRNRLRSLATRLSAVEGRAAAGQEEVLRALHRGYTADCWDDVTAAPGRAAEALAAGRRHLEAAREAAAERRQDWDLALSSLGAAGAAFDEAVAELDAPRARLALLDSVAADPREASRPARFALRDAQKLLSVGAVRGEHGQRLDALSTRLAAAEQLLDRPHPHYLGYARELEQVRVAGQELIERVRAFRARH